MSETETDETDRSDRVEELPGKWRSSYEHGANKTEWDKGYNAAMRVAAEELEKALDSDDNRTEWVLILAQWPDDRGGFARPALERFDDREKAREIHAEYAKNDANNMSDYKLVKRENVDSLPFDVSFDDCNDRFVDTETDRSGAGR